MKYLLILLFLTGCCVEKTLKWTLKWPLKEGSSLEEIEEITLNLLANFEDHRYIRCWNDKKHVFCGRIDK